MIDADRTEENFEFDRREKAFLFYFSFDWHRLLLFSSLLINIVYWWVRRTLEVCPMISNLVYNELHEPMPLKTSKQLDEKEETTWWEHLQTRFSLTHECRSYWINYVPNKLSLEENRRIDRVIIILVRRRKISLKERLFIRMNIYSFSPRFFFISTIGNAFLRREGQLSRKVREREREKEYLQSRLEAFSLFFPMKWIDLMSYSLWDIFQHPVTR